MYFFVSHEGIVICQLGIFQMFFIGQHHCIMRWNKCKEFLSYFQKVNLILNVAWEVTPALILKPFKMAVKWRGRVFCRPTVIIPQETTGDLLLYGLDHYFIWNDFAGTYSWTLCRFVFFPPAECIGFIQIYFEKITRVTVFYTKCLLHNNILLQQFTVVHW